MRLNLPATTVEIESFFEVCTNIIAENNQAKFYILKNALDLDITFQVVPHFEFSAVFGRADFLKLV